MAEVEEWRPHGLPPGAFIPSVESDPHTVVTEKTRTPIPTPLGWIACCVGGGTVHTGGYFYRFQRDDFRLRRRFGARPFEDVELVDWPYGYDGSGCPGVADDRSRRHLVLPRRQKR